MVQFIEPRIRVISDLYSASAIKKLHDTYLPADMPIKDSIIIVFGKERLEKYRWIDRCNEEISMSSCLIDYEIEGTVYLAGILKEDENK